MLEVFRRELPGWTDAAIRVNRCSLRPGKTARSRKAIRDGQLLVVYTLGIELDGGAEREFVLLGAAPAGPEYFDPALDVRHAGLLDHPAVVPFRRLGAYLPDLEAAIFFSLLDPVLPGLAEVSGAQGGSILAPFLDECHAGGRIERIESELKHYKPLHRAVLRVTATFTGPGAIPAPRSFYVKLFGDGRGSESYQDLVGLWSAAQRSTHLRLPEPLGYDPRRNMLVMSEAGGGRALSDWIKRLEHGETLSASELERLDRCMVVMAHALEELQCSGLRAAERRTFQGELERVRADHQLLHAESAKAPDLALAIGRLVARLSALAPEQETLVPAHGGFRHKQTVGDERSLAIIDWDGFCLASPALDAATFLVRLGHCPWGSPGSAPELERATERFRAEFHAALPEVGTRLALYEALVLTEQVLRSFRRSARDDEGADVVRNLAAAAERMLDRVVGPG